MKFEDKDIKGLKEITIASEVRKLDAVCVNESELTHHPYHNLKYTAVGMFFGILFIKSEVVSWFRIQEMFRFQSFHMYGIIGTAILVGMVSILIIKKYKIKTIYGEGIVFKDKLFDKGQIYGGLTFGLGWALVGACPGPIYALIGYGFYSFIPVLLSAIAGTWVYGLVRDKLPH